MGVRYLRRAKNAKPIKKLIVSFSGIFEASPLPLDEIRQETEPGGEVIKYDKKNTQIPRIETSRIHSPLDNPPEIVKMIRYRLESYQILVNGLATKYSMKATHVQKPALVQRNNPLRYIPIPKISNTMPVMID
jgi:hypothetical protein